MSKLSKEVVELKRSMADAEARLSNMNNHINIMIPKSDIVTCEVCGCAIKIGKAIKGKGIVKTRSTNYSVPTHSIPVPAYGIYGSVGADGYNNTVINREDYIYYPYYCKLHAPKELTEEGKKENPEEDNYDNGR